MPFQIAEEILMALSKNIDLGFYCGFLDFFFFCGFGWGFFNSYNENFHVSLNSVFVSVICLKNILHKACFTKFPLCLYHVYIEV